MSEIICKKCKSDKYVKNGLVRGLQRYRCKVCKCNFTNTDLRGKHPAMKALSILLYSMGNMSYRMIGKLLGLSHVTIYEWIRGEAEKLPIPTVAANVEIVTVDEMWHFIQKKHKNSGFGERMILSSGKPWPGFWVGVMMQPAKDSLITSALKEKSSSQTIGRDTIDSSQKTSSLQEKT